MVNGACTNVFNIGSKSLFDSIKNFEILNKLLRNREKSIEKTPKSNHAILNFLNGENYHHRTSLRVQLGYLCIDLQFEATNKILNLFDILIPFRNFELFVRLITRNRYSNLFAQTKYLFKTSIIQT